MEGARRDICCGSLAGVASQLVCFPFDTMRTRLQMASGPMGLRDCARSTWATEGMHGFYKGMVTPLLAQSVYKAVIFTTSTAVRNALNDARGVERSSLATVSIAGATAGAVNAAVVTPVELIRNRLQVQGAAGFAGTQYRGSLDVACRTVSAYGVRGLWTGYASTVARDGPGLALFFFAFEAVRRALDGVARGQSKEAATASVGATTRFGDVVLAAPCAGVAFWTWALPVDTVKSVVQAAGNEARTTASLVAEMWQCGGVRRFFCGWQAAYVRGIPGATTTLCVHTYCSHLWDEL